MRTFREVTYKDALGRLSKVQIPSNAPDSDARYGIPIGPPDISSLNLSPDVEVKLNNELFHRGLFTEKDVSSRRMDVLAALQRALAVDVGKLIDLYRES